MTKTIDVVLKDSNVMRVVDDYIGGIIHSNQDYYEKELLEYFKEYVPTKGIIYDIGANIGNHTLYFSRTLNPKKIYSFEPASELYQMLQFNVRINELENIEIFNYAVGKQNDEVNLKYDCKNTGASSIHLDGNEVVKLFTIDGLNLQKPNFIKIDVEGFEFDVIQGMKNTLKHSNPVLWVEIFPENYDEVNRLLEEFNYIQIDRYSDDYIYVKAIKEDLIDIVKRFKAKPLTNLNDRIACVNGKYRNVTESMQNLKQQLELAEEKYSAIEGEKDDLEKKISLVDDALESMVEKLSILEEAYKDKSEEADRYLKASIGHEKEIQNLISKLDLSNQVNETLAIQKIDLEMELQKEILSKIKLLNKEEETLLNIELLMNKKNDAFMKDIENLQCENEQVIKICQMIELEREIMLRKHSEIQEVQKREIIALQKEEKRLLQIICSHEQAYEKVVKERVNALSLLEMYRNESEKELEKEKREKEIVLSEVQEYKKVVKEKVNALSLLEMYRNKSEKELEKEKREKEIVLSEVQEYKERYEKLSKKYFSLKNSTLGKFTLKYWSFLNRIKK